VSAQMDIVPVGTATAGKDLFPYICLKLNVYG
jgi:hypothetical protein